MPHDCASGPCQRPFRAPRAAYRADILFPIDLSPRGWQRQRVLSPSRSSAPDLGQEGFCTAIYRTSTSATAVDYRGSARASSLAAIVAMAGWLGDGSEPGACAGSSTSTRVVPCVAISGIEARTKETRCFKNCSAPLCGLPRASATNICSCGSSAITRKMTVQDTWCVKLRSMSG